MPSSAIKSANTAISEVVSAEVAKKEKSPRGTYQHYSAKERADIGRRASEYGLNSSITHYAKLNPSRALPMSSDYTWKANYLKELNKRKKEEDLTDITELPNKKRGKPLLLGKELDDQVIAF